MSSMWFGLVVVIVAAATIGVSIVNLIYYNRIRTGTCGAVSHDEATTMFWINIGLIVLASVLFIWGLVNLFMSGKYSMEPPNNIRVPNNPNNIKAPNNPNNIAPKCQQRYNVQPRIEGSGCKIQRC